VSKPLVIVESPAKARTISRFLGGDFVVESSIGHVRDLPRNAADVPSEHKGEAWARLGVDIENDFKPLYVVASEKKQQVTKLRRLLKDASELYLATDEDREGESIAWHLLEVLSPPARMPVKRMVFHEITPAAIRRAVDDWRELDRRLVDAQEARRILDRLYGYEVSPVLWKKVMPKLSAGRVQSVATRMIVERERARMRFRSASWWDIEGTFATNEGSFGAGLVAVDGKRLATGRDFDESGRMAPDADAVVLDETGASGLAERLRDSDFAVRSVEEKPYKRSPYAPFMTSTLQQEAGRKLRYGSQRTMSIAQRLYENGYITYMRAYVEGSDDPNAALEDQEVRLPQLAEGTALNVVDLEPKGHQTQPPARFTEASLVKALEEMGVGRPSTYASIIGTIQDRGYVWKKGSALVPSFVAFSVVGLLEQHFGDLVDYAFTARMEDDLDEIASGGQEAIPWLRRFYFGNGREGLHDLVHHRLGEIDAREVNSIPLAGADGDWIVTRVGRDGPYLQRGDETVSIPEDLAPDELTPERAEELLSAPSSDRLLGEDPDSGLPVYVKAGRFGPYVQLGEMEQGADKPKTASLFKDMSPETVTIEDAL